MEAKKILTSAIVGTSAMTLFSYLLSEAENKNFREPQLLGQLINRLPITCSKEKAQIAGWGLHYVIGLSFTAVYSKLWKQNKFQPSVTSGTVLGVVSGVIGIIGWKLFYEMHPTPPQKLKKSFFNQLLIAHIVFGVAVALTYKNTPIKRCKT